MSEKEKKKFDEAKSAAYHEKLMSKFDKESDASFVQAGEDADKKAKRFESDKGIVFPMNDDVLP